MPAHNVILNQGARKPMGRSDCDGNQIDSRIAQPGIILNAERIAAIGADFKTEREKCPGLSQHKLSELSGVPQTYISELESGHAPHLDHMPVLQQTLGIYHRERVRNAMNFWEKTA